MLTPRRSFALAVMASVVAVTAHYANATDTPPRANGTWQLEMLDDGLDVHWYADCVTAIGRPDLVCVPSDGMPEIQEYSTFAVSVGAQAHEKRFQTLPSDGAWLVLVESPDDEVCVTQKHAASGFKNVCGRLAIDSPAGLCPQPSKTTAFSRCKLRPVPYDNSHFPHLPDPEADGDWFAPWAVYENAGAFPGDLDKWFMLNVSPATLQTGGAGPTPAQRRTIDLLAWQEFIALHWPSDPHLASIRRKLPALEGDVDCPAWAAFRRTIELLPADGSLPIPWDANPSAAGQDDACRILGDHKLAQLSATDIGARLNPEQPDGCILWDIDGFPIFYDVRVNRSAFDYVVSNGLYTAQVPDRLVSFPDGKFYVPGGPGVAKTGTVKAPVKMQGAAAIKTAWKMLGPDDDEDRFVVTLQRDPQMLTRSRGKNDARSGQCAANAEATTQARSGKNEARSQSDMLREHIRFLRKAGLTTQPARTKTNRPTAATTESTADSLENPPPDEPLMSDLLAARNCEIQDGERVCVFGLVAMHVAHKTSNNQVWNWSTFIHRDAFGVDDPKTSKGRQLFATDECKADDSNAGAGNQTHYGDDGRRHTQVCVRFDPEPVTESLNEEAHRMLADSQTDLMHRLSNYRLLAAQWVPPGDFDSRSPRRALNPLMETFDMHRDVDCLSCHQKAAWTKDDGSKVSADFMFFPTFKRPVRSTR